MAPEYANAADKLHPLIPTYAIDCDDEKNKRLCAEQQVQGFPTVKVYSAYSTAFSKTHAQIP
jgi:protein disulfide-isomerase A6